MPILYIEFYVTENFRLAVLLECSDRVNSWKAFMLLGSFVEEIMPELKDLGEQ